MNRTSFGVGIVGAGRIFEQHARALTELGPARARLLAIADVDEAQRRNATSARFIPFAYEDYRSLLDRSDVDLVTVCTPPASHERIVIDALEAGKFVMCEKPLAHTLAAADRIIAAARRYPGKLTTVYQLRYLPEVQRTRWLCDQGRLGRLLFGRFTRYARFDTPAKPAKRGKAAKPGKTRADWWGRWETAGGGVVITQMIHDLDAMCHFFGEPCEVSAVIDTLKDPIESEDTCAVTVRFASGAMVCCSATMTALRTSSAFDVIGESASAHFPWALECLNTKQRDQSLRDSLALFPSLATDPVSGGISAALRTRLWLRGAESTASGSAHTPYIVAVLAAMAEGQPLPVGPDEARASLELCAAIYASALEGRPVTVPIGPANSYYGGLNSADYDGRRRWNRQTTLAVELLQSGATR